MAMSGGFRAGLVVAVLGLAGVFPIHRLTTANDTIDMTTTGAIGAPASVSAATDPKGSLSFRRVLDLLADDKAAEAYEEAKSLPNAVERRAIQWAAIYFHADDIDYRSIARFAEDAPGFAATGTYRTRFEQALLKAEPADATVIDMLGDGMPNTIDAQIRLASAYLADGQKERATTLARSLWVDNFLTATQEAAVLDKLGSLIDRDTHWARAMHLMMHDRARGSERLLPFLTEEQKTLVEARAAVSRKADNAKALLDKVDPAYQDNPVFIFSRVQRARQFELWQDAADWLEKATGEVPDAAEWWSERRLLLRQMLDAGEIDLAFQVAAGYTNGPEGRLVEARFHAGWIALSFLKDAAAAKAQFTEMAKLSTLPDTVTQANYWLARANLALGDVTGAQAAYQAAARYGTVYYGLLARAELGESGAAIRPLPDWHDSQSLFDSNEIVRAVRLLAANDHANWALPLMRDFGLGRKSGGELLLAARLAEEIGAHHLAIAIADTAEQQGIALDLYGFPRNGLPEDVRLAADRAAVYAVVRQESRFQIDAQSGVGARGLMQLMPGTAQDVARELGLDYSASRLVTDAAYNTLLGSTYLATQLKRFDGSLVLAAAAYNAGPGNANKWIKAYGDPREDNVDPVVWVELIPFQETRKYVQRVLGNYLVFREQLGNDGMTLKQALRSIE